MKAENHLFEKENHLPNLHFCVPCCCVSDTLNPRHLTFAGCCGSTAIGMRFGGPRSEAEYTVDGRTPAPVEGKVVYLPLFTGFYTSQVVVWDFFFHQQYHQSRQIII